jgi:hypothetical protein
MAKGDKKNAKDSSEDNKHHGKKRNNNHRTKTKPQYHAKEQTDSNYAKNKRTSQSAHEQHIIKDTRTKERTAEGREITS